MELEEKMHLNFKKFEVVKVLLGKQDDLEKLVERLRRETDEHFE